jgi:hypothetical protein
MKEINECNISVAKPEEKRSLRSLALRWEDNIKTDLGEIGREYGQ